MLDGTSVIVRFGRSGQQLATVVRMTPNGNYVVRKWSRNACQWSGDVRVHPSQVLREATPAECAWVGQDLAKWQRAAARYLAQREG